MEKKTPVAMSKVTRSRDVNAETCAEAMEQVVTLLSLAFHVWQVSVFFPSFVFCCFFRAGLYLRVNMISIDE